MILPLPHLWHLSFGVIYQSDLIVATFSLASFFDTPSDNSFAIPFHDSSLARRMILQKAHFDLFFGRASTNNGVVSNSEVCNLLKFVHKAGHMPRHLEFFIQVMKNFTVPLQVYKILM
jgi:hypothetical protein